MSYIGRLIWTHVIDRYPTADRYKRLQSRRLKQLLQSAKSNVPGQAERLKGASVENWTQIEPITKTEMMASPVDFLNHFQLAELGINRIDLVSALNHGDKIEAGWYQGKVLITKTSGTSGETGLVFNTKETWTVQQAHLIGRIGREILPLTHFLRYAPFRIAFIVLQNPLIVTNQIAQSGGKAGGFLTEVRTIRVDSDQHAMVEEIEQFAPHLIMTYPNILELLAEAKHGNLLHYDPLVLVSGSDYLADTQAKKVVQAFPHSSFSNLYSTSECQPIASTCSEGKMHISNDCCLLEPVDSQGQPTPLGEFSDHVLLTGLLNDFQPFIRYQLNDEVRILAEPCTCGRPQPVMEIRGRSYPNIRVRRGDGTVASINSREVRKYIIQNPSIKRFEVSCQLDEWHIKIFPDCSTEEEVQIFAGKYHADLMEAMDDLKSKFRIEDVLSIHFQFELFDRLSGKNLKRKMFTLIEQPKSDQ